MMATAWGGVAWIIVTLASMVLLAVFGALSGRRLAAIGRTAASESGPLSPALRDRLHHPLLRTSIQLRTAIALGIVFLMTIKPDLVGALLSMGAAIAVGLIVSRPIRSRERVMDPAA
jgi:hypothetical protein